MYTLEKARLKLEREKIIKRAKIRRKVLGYAKRCIPFLVATIAFLLQSAGIGIFMIFIGLIGIGGNDYE